MTMGLLLGEGVLESSSALVLALVLVVGPVLTGGVKTQNCPLKGHVQNRPLLERACCSRDSS